ncbi:hypothetical protein N0U24_01880 [Peribacillus frigoritolerans]|uniref:hypothetical protein n=1 Tax=Peribacillus frigoritolerans TaxID=450367 RepID=UPI0021AA58E6|nr:hypothetical protein [Peribacillus frigoritolerans]MCT4475907.1 hypothetical protein [Peribacillus frigoritolerans]
MPVLGEEKEELALSLNASIRGPDNPFARPNAQSDDDIYYAPAGYIIRGVREHVKNDQGSALREYKWTPNPPDFTISYQQFNDELRNG